MEEEEEEEEHCEAPAQHITRGAALSTEDSDWLLTFFYQPLLVPRGNISNKPKLMSK